MIESTEISQRPHCHKSEGPLLIQHVVKFVLQCWCLYNSWLLQLLYDYVMLFLKRYIYHTDMQLNYIAIGVHSITSIIGNT